MDQHRRHNSRPGVWNGTAFVPLPATDTETEVWFALPSAAYSQQYWEALNGVPRGDGRIELRAVPALAYGISYGDTVATVPSAEGPLVVRGVIGRGEFTTFRLRLRDAKRRDRDVFKTAEVLARLGAVVEVYSSDLIAIACPNALVESMRSSLQRICRRVGGQWEEA